MGQFIAFVQKGVHKIAFKEREGSISLFFPEGLKHNVLIHSGELAR